MHCVRHSFLGCIRARPRPPAWHPRSLDVSFLPLREYIDCRV